MTVPRSSAQSPFDDTTANIVLRTSDNVDFYVYKEVLKLASPFFHTLFSLPQPTSQPLFSTSSDPIGNAGFEFDSKGIPIIRVAEESVVIDHILRVCYPHRNPNGISTLHLAEGVLAAALKYEIEIVIDGAKRDFVTLGSNNPTEMYMFSCRQNLENEARIAADILRKRYYPQGERDDDSLPPPGPHDFARIALEIYSDNCPELPAVYLYRLLRHICFGDIPSFCDPEAIPDPIPGPGNLETQGYGFPPEFAPFLVDYPADILLQSSDGVTIPVHKFILRAVSAVSIILQSEADNCPKWNGIPIVALSHPAALVYQLMRECYPPLGAHSPTIRPEDCIHLWKIAQAYGMVGVASVMKTRWGSSIPSDPLNAYFVAKSNGWAHETQQAAYELATGNTLAVTRYVPSMSMRGTSHHYYTLLVHLQHLGQQLKDMVSQPLPSFPGRRDETWNDISYACTRSISPLVVFRAFQRHIKVSGRLVDPPARHTFQNNFQKHSAEFIRQMVSDSKGLEDQHREEVDKVSEIYSSHCC